MGEPLSERMPHSYLCSHHRGEGTCDCQVAEVAQLERVVEKAREADRQYRGAGVAGRTVMLALNEALRILDQTEDR